MSDPNDEDVKDTFILPKAGLQAGIILKGRYRIEKELGAGGIGMVFLAKDTQLYDRPVVIKILHEKLQDSSWIQKKFRQEIEALVRIKHPGVVGVFDAGEMLDGKMFVVMEFVQGVDLRSVLKGLPGGMELERAADIIRQIGPALTAAHDEGVFHCDLKPENIMLQTSKQGDELVKLIDFGVAKVKDSLVSSQTETRIAGTFLYMAPEQLMGHPSASSDIYALGVIAYEMLTQKGPFQARTVTHLYELQRSGVQIQPKQIRSDIPETAQNAILKALSFDPVNRYQRARDFTEDLAKGLVSNAETEKAEVRRSASVYASTIETPRRTAPLYSKPAIARKKLHPALIIIPILIALVFGAYAFWPRTQPVKPPPTVVDIPTPAAPVKELTLNYYLEMQKYRDGKPYEEPRKLAKEVLFEKDYRVRLFLSSAEPGHLYLVNEGPVQRNGSPSYNVLFPTTSTNNGSSLLTPAQTIQIPAGQNWFKFDAEAGTEKLWMIWGTDPVAELEAIKSVANPTENGIVSNQDHLNTLKNFFAQHSDKKPAVEKRDENTVVKSKGQILVNLLELEHY